MESFKKTLSDIRENVNDIKENVSENLNEIKDNGKRGVAHVIYGRSIMIILMLVLQVLVLLAMMGWYRQYVQYFYGGYILLTITVVLVIMNNDENPVYKIAWLIPVLVFPVFGTLFYLWVKLQPTPMMLRKRVLKTTVETARYMPQDETAMEELQETDPGFFGTANYLFRNIHFPVYRKTKTTFFPLGEDKYQSLLEELEKAENFIFMEYFIISRGKMWDSILEVLKRKAAQGVEVRVMYDGMCSFMLLPYSYPKTLESYGIKCCMYAPIKPVLSVHQNNRDHRKILVIDGKVAYTGGVNLADEYINEEEHYGHWKDTAIMLEGRAVNSFTLMFLQMWNINKGTTEDFSKYIRSDFPEQEENGYVIPYGDTPFDGENVGEHVYMDMLNQAQKYVHIMTPYLILDNEMKESLKYAAKRGVDVKIIMPHIPDKKLAFYLARSYYSELIKAGVKIYEYTPGFVHAKIFVSDDLKATVGSINLDFRSLYLHFECGTYMYGASCVENIETDYQTTLEKCHLVTPEYLKKLPLYQKYIGSVLKIFAPLM